MRFRFRFNSIAGKHIVTLVSTVTQNKKKYSKREIKQAALARRYQINLGPCTSTELIKLITRGKLDNNRIVAQDVIRAYDIWGPALANLKGKTTSHKTELQEEISILDKQLKTDQIMFVDLMFVNSVAYLISVFKPLDYVSVTKLSKKNISSLLDTVLSQMNSIKRHGLKVTMCRVDGESAISTEWFQSKISAEGTILDTTGAGEAVSVVERKIRQVKERFRGIACTLPYKLTEFLESWLVKYLLSRIVLVPTSNSSEYISPREKLWGRRINVNKELRHGFGDYVQVHSNEINNSMHERTAGAIALMPSGNLEGSWFYYLLQNGKVVKRNKATAMPITDEIIAYLDNKAANRKGKIHTVDKPIFERGNHHEILEDDINELDINEGGNDQPNAFNEPDINNLLNHNDVPVLEEEYPEEYNQDDDDINNNDIENIQNIYDYDNINEVNNNDEVNIDMNDNIQQHDIEINNHVQNIDDIDDPDGLNIRGDNQVLLDDIFGIDDDEDEVIAHELDVAKQPKKYSPTAVELYNVDNPRKSGRNHQLGKWNVRTVGVTTHKDIDYGLTKRSFSLNMTISQGIQKLGYTAIQSIVKEMIQMNDMQVLEGIKTEDLSKQQLGRIITSSMFLKEKFTADGVFDKLKARLVAGGHLQDRDIYDKGSSPTVSTSSVFLIAAIAASRNSAVACIDFPGAFLNSVMPETGDHTVFMRLNKFLTSVLVQIDPTYSTYVQPNGTCVVRLKRALYGCVESAAMWYNKLSNDLTSLGYKKNRLDICVFNRIENDNSKTTLILHVDDMKISCKTELLITQVIKEIEAILYPGLTKQRGRIINYLGMSFDYSEKNKVIITMANFVSEILAEWTNVTGTAETPAAPYLFRVRTQDESPLLNDVEREKFHRVVAQFQYLVKRVRPDMLVTASYLSKRVQHPQRDDMLKLNRLIQYLRGTKEKGIILEGINDFNVVSYVDASYGVHPDMKGHSGCVIGIGKGPIFAKSNTQKLNTKSSTECELVALSDSATQIIWTRNFLEEQGIIMKPAKIYQDNMSTIALVKNGKSNSDRTRHIAIRFFFIADRVASNELCIEYMPTEEMLADILTKPLQGTLFKKLRDKLLNWY